MQKMKKRLCALLMTVLMVLSIVPMTAFASEAKTPTKEQIDALMQKGAEIINGQIKGYAELVKNEAGGFTLTVYDNTKDISDLLADIGQVKEQLKTQVLDEAKKEGIESLSIGGKEIKLEEATMDKVTQVVKEVAKENSASGSESPKLGELKTQSIDTTVKGSDTSQSFSYPTVPVVLNSSTEGNNEEIEKVEGIGDVLSGDSLRNGSAGKTVAEIKATFGQGATIQVSRSGQALGDTVPVGTGDVVEFLANGVSVKKITIVLLGDIASVGIGKLDSADVTQMLNHYVGVKTLTGVREMAAHTAGHATVNNMDVVKLLNMIVGQ